MRKIFLHTYGCLHFAKIDGPETTYTTVIENYHIDDAKTNIRITCDTLCEQTIETIDATLKRLEKMHDAAQQAYLEDFNDEEENIYLTTIYKKVLSECDLAMLKQQACKKDWLLFAVNLVSVDITVKGGDVSTVFTYIKGYELAHKYKFGKDCEHTELIFQAGPCVMKEQLSAFIDIRELPVINEICSRFRKDWQNYPLKSYFIYLMVRRIKTYLKTVMQ